MEIVEFREAKPPGGRPLHVMVRAGATQNRPRWDASRTLIIGGRDLIDEHVRAAGRVNPTADLIYHALRQGIKKIAHFCTSSPGRVAQRRGEAAAFVKSIASKLQPDRLKWVASISPKSPTSGLRYPVFLFLPNALGFPDREFLHDLAAEMPIVGDIGATPTPNFEPRVKGATMPYEQRKAGIPARNRVAIERIQKSAESKFAAERWGRGGP